MKSFLNHMRSLLVWRKKDDLRGKKHPARDWFVMCAGFAFLFVVAIAACGTFYVYIYNEKIFHPVAETPAALPIIDNAALKQVADYYRGQSEALVELEKETENKVDPAL